MQLSREIYKHFVGNPSLGCGGNFLSSYFYMPKLIERLPRFFRGWVAGVPPNENASRTRYLPCFFSHQEDVRIHSTSGLQYTTVQVSPQQLQGNDHDRRWSTALSGSGSLPVPCLGLRRRCQHTGWRSNQQRQRGDIDTMGKRRPAATGYRRSGPAAW